MQTEQISGTSTTELEVSPKAQPPAPVADEQKTGAVPASGADEQNSEQAAETPEQIEAKKESRRQRSNARKAQALADARAEAKILRERLEKLEAQPPKPDQETTGEPKREAFQDYEAYLRAVAKYDAEQATDKRLKSRDEARESKAKQEQATAGNEKVAKAWAEREATFQAATKDYEEVVTPFLEDELKTLSQQARAAIVESDVGPALLHHLALLAESKPEEFERIAGLSPVRQIAELGKLEAKVSMPAKKTTSAPAPASTTSGGRSSSKDPKNMDQTEYEAWRKTQGARWAR